MGSLNTSVGPSLFHGNDPEKNDIPIPPGQDDAAATPQKLDLERLGRQRPDVFKSTLSEIFFAASMLVSMLMAVCISLLTRDWETRNPGTIILPRRNDILREYTETFTILVKILHSYTDKFQFHRNSTSQASTSSSPPSQPNCTSPPSPKYGPPASSPS